MPIRNLKSVTRAVRQEYDFHIERTAALKLVLDQLTKLTGMDGAVRRQAEVRAVATASDRPARHKRKPVSAAARKAISKRMKAYWSERRREAKSS